MRRNICILLAIATGCFLGLRIKVPFRNESSDYREPREYRLPANDIPPETRKRLHPWIAGFIGLSPEEADRRVAARWSSIQRPSLIALRETLTRFSVDAIIDYGKGGRIRAFRSTTKEIGCGDFWYLPAPLDAGEVKSKLTPAGLEENEALQEFLIHFSGLAEDTTMAGDFVYSDSPWPLFTDSWDGSIEGFDDWKDSLMLYHARNGCHVLVRKDGRVAWWVMQEHFVDPLAKDIDEFVLQFTDHRKISWPYDPYGAPESER